MGTHKKYLREALLKNTHNIYLVEEIRKKNQCIMAEK